MVLCIAFLAVICNTIIEDWDLGLRSGMCGDGALGRMEKPQANAENQIPEGSVLKGLQC